MQFDEIKEYLKRALKEVAVPMPKTTTASSYDSLFPDSVIFTALDKINMEESVFKMFGANGKQLAMYIVRNILKDPDIVVKNEGEKLYSNSDTIHFYAKSYIMGNKTIQTIVVCVTKNHTPYVSYAYNINSIVDKMNAPNQLLLTSDTVKQAIKTLTQEEIERLQGGAK